MFLGTDDPPDRLLADADQAMYRQKQQRRAAAAPPQPTQADDDSAYGDL